MKVSTPLQVLHKSYQTKIKNIENQIQSGYHNSPYNMKAFTVGEYNQLKIQKDFLNAASLQIESLFELERIELEKMCSIGCRNEAIDEHEAFNKRYQEYPKK